ncbi:MAG: hypothetical protein OER88_09600 [Planctomycetota bacterium]|nr:hypothetical protein [Planctomycetota bacterium]
MNKSVILAALLVAGSAAFVVFRSDAAPQPTAFDKKASANTATLQDWASATREEKTRFANAYVIRRLGAEDLRRQSALWHGIDSAIQNIKKRPIDPDERDEVLERSLLSDTADSTAEFLKWPAPR